MITKDQIIETLRRVEDPQQKKDLVSLNRVLRVDILGNKIILDIETSSPAMHVKKKIEQRITAILHESFGNEIQIALNLVVQAASTRTDSHSILPGVKNIIAVGSGKGGVGKSTVASNLAIALMKTGAKVGLIDADIYGPSVPVMFDTQYVRPNVVQKEDGKTYIEPVDNYGIKLLSIGFFSDLNQAVVWRGPMAAKALSQMFSDAEWGELDYLLIDLPPGTGDIPLTLVQTVPVSGAIIVSTPQEVALADVRKALSMFNHPNIHVPILGLVENMAWFTPAELPENKYYIFGKNGVKKLAEEFHVPLLAQIPLVQSICESGDKGTPAVLQETNPITPVFIELAEKVIEQLDLISIKNTEISETN